MVKRSVAFLFFVNGLAAFSEPATRFFTECTKSRLYQGESVTCHFILSSADERLEVEVAKFPEFRGFWSENSALRQGPLLLIPDPSSPGHRRVVIGTYQLIPMVGGKAPILLPMRLVVRRFGSEGIVEEQLASEAVAFTILPLPPAPADDRALFHSAVGQFNLRVETPVVRYVPKEPLALRFLVTGSGNFPELNTLPIVFPPSIRLVSQRSASAGSGPFQTKVFELIVTNDSEAPMDLPPAALVFFNPFLGKFEKVTSESVHMEPMPVPAETMAKESMELGPIEGNWSNAGGMGVQDVTEWIQTHPGFWSLQALLGALWMGLFGYRIFRLWQLNRQNNPRIQLRRRWDALFQTLGHAGNQTPVDPLLWLGRTEQLLFETIVFRALRSGTVLKSRKQAIEFARTCCDSETARNVGHLFSLYEQACYSQQRPTPPPAAKWRAPLGQLRKRLLT